MSLISIPVIGYTAAYFYLVGKYAFYNLPSFFVEISTESAIISSLYVAAMLLIAFSFIYLIARPTSRKTAEEFKPVTWKALGATFIIVLILFIVVTFMVVNTTIAIWLKIILIIFMFLLLFVYIFIAPFFQYPSERGYLNKYNLRAKKLFLIEKEKNEKKKSTKTDFTLLIAILRFKYIFYILFIII